MNMYDKKKLINELAYMKELQNKGYFPLNRYMVQLNKDTMNIYDVENDKFHFIYLSDSFKKTIKNWGDGNEKE
ncbi:MAG: hypothetical protein ACI31M_03475 [Bacilli bacterium]